MNIKAKLDSGHTVRIIALVPGPRYDIVAIYVDSDGEIHRCFTNHLIIIDPEYELEQPSPSLPREW